MLSQMQTYDKGLRQSCIVKDNALEARAQRDGLLFTQCPFLRASLCIKRHEALLVVRSRLDHLNHQDM